MAKPAAAELVDHSHQHVVATFDEVICRIPVTTTLDHVLNSKERLSSTGFPLFKSTGSGTYTSTNPANGKSVLLGFAGSSSDLTAVDNGDGTVTVRTAVTGITVQIKTPNGPLAARDAGRLVFVNVIDYGGTPADPSDDTVLSSDLESISGPHPVQNDFHVFCDAVTAALT